MKKSLRERLKSVGLRMHLVGVGINSRPRPMMVRRYLGMIVSGRGRSWSARLVGREKMYHDGIFWGRLEALSVGVRWWRWWYRLLFGRVFRLFLNWLLGGFLF